MCAIHEVEVDNINNDLSFYHCNVFLRCFNLLLCYFRTTVGSIVLMNLVEIIHLN